MALAALAAIERGVGVIMIDPKPDEFLLGCCAMRRAVRVDDSRSGAKWQLRLQPPPVGRVERLEPRRDEHVRILGAHR
jgi:hypothetical protein